jgi:hypothetical protein
MCTGFLAMVERKCKGYACGGEVAGNGAEESLLMAHIAAYDPNKFKSHVYLTPLVYTCYSKLTMRF